MTHRKYSRTRNAIHKAMARNPGQRKPKYQRLEQGRIAREIATVKDKLPRNMPAKKKAGIVDRLLNRKKGS